MKMRRMIALSVLIVSLLNTYVLAYANEADKENEISQVISDINSYILSLIHISEPTRP